MQKMNSKFLLLVAASLGAAVQLQAQFPGGGFGPPGGFGGATTSRSRTTAPPYPNNGVGGAVVSVDPGTRTLIVMTDEDTGKYIS